MAVVECLRSSGEVVVVGDHLPDGSLVAADVVLVGRIGAVAPLVRVVTEVDHLLEKSASKHRRCYIGKL